MAKGSRGGKRGASGFVNDPKIEQNARTRTLLSGKWESIGTAFHDGVNGKVYVQGRYTIHESSNGAYFYDNGRFVRAFNDTKSAKRYVKNQQDKINRLIKKHQQG